MQVTDKLGGPFTPPGFYYKTFIRPRKLWPLYEKILRGAAGLGPLDPDGSRQERIDVEHRHVDVVVIGGGQAGLEAATAAAEGGESVVVIDEGYDVGGALLADREGIGTAAELRAARGRGGRRAARAGDRDRPVRAGPRAGRLRQPAAQVPRAPRHRRERDRRAAARLPGQRPRRRDAAGRRAPPRQRVLDQARRARRRPHGRRPRPRRRCRSRGCRRRDRPHRRLPRGRQPGDRGAGQGRQGGAGLDRRHPREGGPGRDVRQPAAELQAPRPGRRARRVRRGPRRLRPDRPARPRRGRRRRHRRRRRACGAEPDPRPPRRQVLRLLLRGPDDEGPEVRDRRGLRLDRALEALHDGDDGAVPGPALPHRTRSASTPRRPGSTRTRSARPRPGRRTRRSRWACSPARRRSRASAPRCTTATRTWAAR